MLGSRIGIFGISLTPRARRLLVRSAAVGAALLGLLVPSGALAASPTKLVSYHGYRVIVPANWPVYDLRADPGVCVRFDRHAVYLGVPGTDQRCATSAAGRTEALLIQPLSGPRTGGAQTVRSVSLAGADAGSGTLGRLVDRTDGIVVTATWNTDPSLIARTLGVRSVSSLALAARLHPAPWRADGLDSRRFGVRAASYAATPGEVYTGTAFDACATPSSAKMAAWGSSAYRAIGVYIGGSNLACSQPNLTGSWVAQQSARGWHLIPIYVGLQAPSNSCGCAPISPRNAAGQGHAAGVDAVTQAQAIGLGAGNPIYYDMEAYARTRRNSTAVLAFLQAWTGELHAAGYKSGVYGSDDSGIEDLVARVGSAYVEPDEIWIANWNGRRTTSDWNVPSSEWAAHQRVHQYAGAHNERHGRVTINIDSDYVDAPTAASGQGSVSVAPATSRPRQRERGRGGG